MRIDKVLADLYPEFSRSAIQKWLRQGLVLVEDEVPSQRDRVAGGEQIEIDVPEAPVADWVPQPIELDILHEDDHIIVINKPAGMVVHPGAGNRDGTMLNALLYHDPALATLPRAGIVHRLDKDTSGVLVVARTERSRNSLIQQLAGQTLTREYVAVVQGSVISGGTIDLPIGRDRHDRRRMTVTPQGRPAVTYYRVVQRFRAHSLLRVNLATGRTHQIRLHMKDRGYPLVGDPVYGGRLRLPRDAGLPLQEALRAFRRQALHASKLGLIHPADGAPLQWRQPMPGDMAALVSALERDQRRHQA